MRPSRTATPHSSSRWGKRWSNLVKRQSYAVQHCSNVVDHQSTTAQMQRSAARAQPCLDLRAPACSQLLPTQKQSIRAGGQGDAGVQRPAGAHGGGGRSCARRWRRQVRLSAINLLFPLAESPFFFVHAKLTQQQARCGCMRLADRSPITPLNSQRARRAVGGCREEARSARGVQDLLRGERQQGGEYSARCFSCVSAFTY